MSACALEHLKMRSEDGTRKIICQHPELSIEGPGQVLPLVVVKTDRENLEVLKNEGIMDLCAILMSFQETPLYTMLNMSVDEIKTKCPNLRDDFGKGKKKTLKNICDRAIAMDNDVNNRLHEYMMKQSADTLQEMAHFPSPGTVNIEKPDFSSAPQVPEEEAKWYAPSVNWWYDSNWNSDGLYYSERYGWHQR